MLDRIRNGYAGCNFRRWMDYKPPRPAGATTRGTAVPLSNRSTTVTPQPLLKSGTLISIGLAAIAMLTFASVPTSANGDGGNTESGVTQTRLVEWDLPQAMDARPGAIAVDHYGNQGGRLWFVTRDGFPARLYQFEPPRNLKGGKAQWVSWPLHPTFTGTTGGVKKVKTSYDRKFAFVRTMVAVQRIDTETSERVTFPDELSFVSDIAVDNRHNVYSTESGFVKQLMASSKCTDGVCPPAVITKWDVDPVDHTVGTCSGGVDTEPCISGVTVHPKYQHLVYFSDNESNMIGELDTSSKSCSCTDSLTRVRYWSLDPVGAFGPRQLNFDQDGTLWMVTASGHLVSLNPKSDRMTRHEMPERLEHDPFGVAPDGGRIGYTDISRFDDQHIVAVLRPRGDAVVSPPTSIWVSRMTEEITPICDAAPPDAGEVPSIARHVPTTVTSKPDGVFVEAFIEQNSELTQMRESRAPLGISPDWDRAAGTFFYTVGEATDSPAVNRVGVARLPRDAKQKGKKERDDEDCDDDGKRRGDDDDDDDDGLHNDLDDDDDGDGILDLVDDDDDNDGIKNEHDHKDGKEAQDHHTNLIAAGQADDYILAASPSTVAFVALAVADDPLAPISIDIFDAAGAVVASVPATAGLATMTIVPPASGEYTVRVTNHAVGAVGIATTLLSREPWPILSTTLQ